MELTHIDSDGKARMVDISGKKETEREAKAFGKVRMSPKTYDIIKSGQGPKGDIFTVAKIAGVMGAKKTHTLIPLCHPLSITHIDVNFDFIDTESAVEIISTVRTKGQTGVEMEALTCSTVVALTIYDMCKAIDKSIELGPFYLLEKSGGKSGVFKRQ
ncbi:MAG TPA: cyclic pyranopterin monophosphate synthase MoaC [Syntrophorhabdaceae bacterium]|jgi:cyclic pyranopterin phosphate synthase|nr:cyclic pyranopterin monophosphate synthase MoaC [Syntrophorhabdaceae bacterium]MDI9561422.1 cyclic pyranopterin monophosphate synthase MoaC [Pseudomonadota bacterium]HOF57443.1 cyclic pyranopterin monophosphate synthase MoaC [Syntrophorhabdaceae bacterium]HOG39688.1 cyclic pyranopterin monophosphate synthase MoaC [Syntrophorhabdaceae bacterium]HOS05903.1 cyclic pyranopterin monophosphate synthase MoaC [Syntrophorhabdaceae bacterium]